jgi:signal transduction histidine kinase
MDAKCVRLADDTGSRRNYSQAMRIGRAGGVLGSAGGITRAFAEAPGLDFGLVLVAFVGLLAGPALGQDGAHLSVAAGLLSGVASLPLVVRRRYPLGVLTLVLTGLLGCLAVFHRDIAAVAVAMLAVYTVGLQGRRVRSLLVGVAMAPVVTAAVAITSGGGLEAGTIVAGLALVLAALAAGDARRGRRALVQAAAEEREREHEAATRHRLDAERLRLSHERHDIVAHTLVAINVRAAAAAHAQRDQPGEGVGLQEIRRSSADARAELRSTLKLFRPARLVVMAYESGLVIPGHITSSTWDW